MRYYPLYEGRGKRAKTAMIMTSFLVLQVVIICFVRKGLDKVFTQRELRWLDEILPIYEGRGKRAKTAMIMTNFLVLQVVIICFVRKGLDKVFTQRELRWLDEILPSI